MCSLLSLQRNGIGGLERQPSTSCKLYQPVLITGKESYYDPCTCKTWQPVPCSGYNAGLGYGKPRFKFLFFHSLLSPKLSHRVVVRIKWRSKENCRLFWALCQFIQYSGLDLIPTREGDIRTERERERVNMWTGYMRLSFSLWYLPIEVPVKQSPEWREDQFCIFRDHSVLQTVSGSGAWSIICYVNAPLYKVVKLHNKSVKAFNLWSISVWVLHCSPIIHLCLHLGPIYTLWFLMSSLVQVLWL